MKTIFEVKNFSALCHFFNIYAAVAVAACVWWPSLFKVLIDLEVPKSLAKKFRKNLFV